MCLVELIKLSLYMFICGHNFFLVFAIFHYVAILELKFNLTSEHRFECIDSFILLLIELIPT